MLKEIEKLLIEGNFKFQGKINQNRESYLFDQKIPKYPILFLACMDLRIDVNQIFQFNPGDVIILRNAGNTYTIDMMRSILIAIHKFNIKYIIILGHIDCGMTNLNLKELREKFPNEFLKRLSINYSDLLTKLDVFFKPFNNEISNVINQINALQEIKAFFPHVEIIGMLYDAQTGWIFKQEEFRDLLIKENHYKIYKGLLYEKSQELSKFLKANDIQINNEEVIDINDKASVDESKPQEDNEFLELDEINSKNIKEDHLQKSSIIENADFEVKISKFQVPKIYFPKINIYTPKINQTVKSRTKKF